MQKVRTDLENCYGISKLEHEFDFSHHSTVGIYAPNGAMKTSFAKTFQDLQRNKETKDLIFPARITKRVVNKEDGNPLQSEEVFVVEPYNQDFRSEKMSTLLVNKDLKLRYDDILIKIDEHKERFLKELKKLSGLKVELIEREVSLVFASTENDFFRSLGRLEKEVDDGKSPEFADITYTEIFNPKVEAVLKTEEVRDKLHQYVRTYEDLISKSRYFKQGVFNHTNAATIAKSLADNGFFEADHSVFLRSTEGDSDIKTVEELEAVIENEKQSILNSPALKAAFEEVDKKLTGNAEVRRFRDYIATHVKVLPELGGPRLNGLRQKLWLSYFKAHQGLYKALVDEYEGSKAELEDIAQKASAEAVNWSRVVGIFNQRFTVPFTLKIENQAGVILQEQVPSIVFEFKDPSGDTAVVGQTELLSTLSTGEKRALYILNIIFEVEARRSSGQQTLFIVDDVADSFDYKNKYAIIEYLKEVSEEPNFRQIILTHNFDFFRTIERKIVHRNNCYAVEKSAKEVKLVAAKYIRDPFKHWMDHLEEDDVQLVASISFARNLIQYTRGTDDADYQTLTALLHVKSDTKNITKGDLEKIYAGIFPNRGFKFTNPDTKIFDLLMKSVADCLSATGVTNLENKILLAIAIRLKAEIYMLNKLTDKSEPDSRQTQELIRRYKTEFGLNSGEEEAVATLDEVDLMTSENIHLNSFMYEPILDMSDDSLKKLCVRVDALK